MTDSDHLTPRQMRAAERVLEDEGLSGGLPDEPARQLVRWAGEAAVRAAAPGASDAQTDAALAAIRQAARQAARQATAGQDVVALAQAALTQLAPEREGTSPLTPHPSPLTPHPSPLRRRIESLRVRLISLISHRTN